MQRFFSHASSSNRLDVEVLREIVDREVFRHQVREIIWDDARFIAQPEDASAAYLDWNEQQICPNWFFFEYSDNLRYLQKIKRRQMGRPDFKERATQIKHLMSAEDCWIEYGLLLQAQL